MPEHSRRLTSEGNDVRMEDYLNDKIQSHADLESLDALIRNVKHQQELLRQQLANADSILKRASHTATAQRSKVLQTTNSFKRQQKEIDRRLLIVTNSDASDDAALKFSKGMQRLERLDVAKSYVELLSRVEQLSTEARRNFRVSPEAALNTYMELRAATGKMKKIQPAAEFAAPHVVDHVEKATDELWAQMKNAFGSGFEATLEKMNWPGKEMCMTSELAQEWSQGVVRLLELQRPELAEYEANHNNASASRDPLILLPLEVMTRPLELRFKYHFEGDRPTNQLQKPEFFLQHIEGLLNTYEGFLSAYLQPILYSHFRESDLALNPIFINSTSALIVAVLPMVRQKIFQILPQVSDSPQLMSHLMHELMGFDTTLREEWGYGGGRGSEAWKGITWEILVQRDWFSTWLQVEKDFALTRYEEIIQPADSSEIDYESVDPGITKPTRAAIRVNDLLETVTERYRPLSSFSQKLRFLIDIQISIFDKFHTRLHSSLEAYLTMTSSLGRKVQGISREDQASLQGIGGLERLCRVYGSAEYLERKMRDWSDDVFFLELWDELQYRARNNVQDGRKVIKDMTVEAIAEITSSNVGSDAITGALFDETSSAYRRLRVRAEEVIIETISYSVREGLKLYCRINPWSSISPELGPMSITAEIETTIQQLSSYLSFLSKILADAPLRRVSRQVGHAIQDSVWNGVLMTHNFSTLGVAQLQRDMNAIWEMFDSLISDGFGRNSMRRLYEAIQLLSLPYISEGADELENSTSGLTSIQVVEERVYRDNESARDVLEELDMETLTESEARNVLDKRVELGL